MKVKSYNCPSCGAPLNRSRQYHYKFCRCSYCGVECEFDEQINYPGKEKYDYALSFYTANTRFVSFYESFR